MEKRAIIQEESKAKEQANRKSWPVFEDEEESKDAKVEMMMQPQDYVTEIAEGGKEAKIKQITEAYEQDMAGKKKILQRAKQIKVELVDITETYQKNALERTDELEQLGQFSVQQSKVFSKKILELSELIPLMELEASMNKLETEIKQRLAEMD